MKKTIRSLLFLLLSLSFFHQAVAADTLSAVQERDKLRCGVNGQLLGFSFRDDRGRWQGMDVDFCRAVAAAVLGDAQKVTFVPLTNAARLDAFKGDRIDLLARNTTWTLSRDTEYGLSFVGVFYFDGQAFMVPRAAQRISALELSGVPLCVQSGTTSLDNVQGYFARNRMKLRLQVYPDLDSAAKAYLSGECGALTGDHSQLQALRTVLQEPRAHRILPEIISKEPLSPAVPKGDARWFDIVRWTLFTLINAEEMGIDANNVDQALALASRAETRRLLDVEGGVARQLGLSPGWAVRIIRLGNYGELFDRNLGAHSPLKMKRGLNALWNNGGLLYAPPSR